MGVQGLTCANNTPGSLAPEDLASNVEAITTGMGMSQECVQTASESIRQDVSSGAEDSLSYGGGVTKGPLGAGLGFGVTDSTTAWQETSNSVDTEHMSRGCGTMVADTSSVLNSIRNINCTITEAQTRSQAVARGRAQVILEATGTADKYSDEALALLNQNAADARAALANARNELLANLLYDSMQNADAAIVQFQKDKAESGGITISGNATIAVESDISVAIVTETSQEIASKIEADTADIAETVARNQIQQNLGSVALPANTRQLINRRVRDFRDNINAEVAKSLNENNIDVTSDGTVKLSGDYIKLGDNAKLTATSHIDVKVEAATFAAINAGKQIATEILRSTSSENVLDQDVAGTNDLIDALGEAAAAVIEAGNAPVINAQNTGGGLFGGLFGDDVVKYAMIGALVAGPGFLVKPVAAVVESTGIAPKIPPAVKLPLNVAVKVYVGYTVVTIVQELLAIITDPWGMLYDPMGTFELLYGQIVSILIAVAVFALHCVLLNKTASPLACLFKF